MAGCEKKKKKIIKIRATKDRYELKPAIIIGLTERNYARSKKFTTGYPNIFSPKSKRWTGSRMPNQVFDMQCLKVLDQV